MTQSMRSTLHELGWNDQLIDAFIVETPETAEPAAEIELIADAVQTSDLTDITINCDAPPGRGF